jgi:ribose transport system permease protein
MRHGRHRLSFGFDRFSGLYLMALFIIIFSVWKPQLFPTAGTVDSVASDQAIPGLLALAVMVPLVTGAYDLSVGAVANLATILVIWLQTAHHLGVWTAILFTLIVSLAVGAINAVLVVRLHVNSFIATLGVASIIAAVQTIISGNEQPLPITSPGWLNLTQKSVGGFEVVVLYLVVAAVLIWILLEWTPAGRFMRATGANPEAARLAGVKVGKWTAIALIISAAMSGVAGVLFGSLLGPSLTYGQGFLLPAFAAVFLGSTQVRVGAFNVWGTIIALFALATGVQGMEFVTGVQWLNEMFNGVALIAAVAFAVWRQRAATKRSRVGQSVQGPPTAGPDEPGPTDEAPSAIRWPLRRRVASSST